LTELKVSITQKQHTAQQQRSPHASALQQLCRQREKNRGKKACRLRTGVGDGTRQLEEKDDEED
jgi:hypothetical protein